MLDLKNQSCILVVDANILIQDFWMKGDTWNHLLKRGFLSHKLVIPHIALEESVSNIERRADDLLKRIEEKGLTDRLSAQYKRLFDQDFQEQESSEDLVQRYKEFISQVVDNHNGLIADTPDVDISTILQRSLERRKPFNKGDKGFRDTLIWLNIVDLVEEFSLVSFVSANTSDYAEGSSLHPDLEQDLAPVIPEGVTFKYFKGLSEFIASMDRDGEAGSEYLRNALMTHGYSGFKLERWVSANIIDLLSAVELDGVEWTALPYWAEAPRLYEVESLTGLEVHEGKSLDTDRIELFCEIALIGLFQCCILYSSWEKIIHPIQLMWVDDKSDNTWTNVGIRSTGTFLLRAVFDLDAAEIIEHDIVPIRHNFSHAMEVLEELKEV